MRKKNDIGKDDILVVIDMQNDFIDGSLGSADAQKIVGDVNERISEYILKAGSGNIYYTMDTHDENYLESAEGRILPVEHCLYGSQGWEIAADVPADLPEDHIIYKTTFGSNVLGNTLTKRNSRKPIRTIELIGVCTDICVIANAVIAKTYLPECEVAVNAGCCAGSTKQNHFNALSALNPMQINVI